MPVIPILVAGGLLLGLLALLIIYLDRRDQRKQELKEKQEETRQREAQAREKLFEDETMDPIDRELEDEK